MSESEFYFLALVVLAFSTFALALMYGRANTLDRSPGMLED